MSQNVPQASKFVQYLLVRISLTDMS